MGALTGGSMAVNNELHTSETEHQELLNFQAIVHPDGGEAKIVLHTSQGEIWLSASIEQIAAMHTEAQCAATIMQYRRFKSKDAWSCVEALFRSALRPTHTSLMTDQQNGDRIFIMQFADRLPIAIRRTVEQCAEAVEELATEARRTAN